MIKGLSVAAPFYAEKIDEKSLEPLDKNSGGIIIVKNNLREGKAIMNLKKIAAAAVTLCVALGTMSAVSAEVAATSWSEGIQTEAHAITIPSSLEGGAYSNQFKGVELTAEGKTYELIVDLSSDYTDGQLFCTSLGLGTSADDYSTEFVVQTQKTANGFVLTAGVAPGESITITDPGIYTYQWTVSKTDDGVSAAFKVAEVADQTLNFTVDEHLEALNNSTCTRYLWAFGREVNGNYVLDRDLVLYTQKPTINAVSVVDGDDGFTPVETPKEGQKLTANVVLADGRTIGSYPVDSHIQYTWYYVENDQVLGHDPVFTVTSDNLEKTIAVKVEGIHGFAGEAVWKAASPINKPEATPSTPSVESTYDDGGPFTKDVCGNVFDRWGNMIYEAPACAVSGGYQVPNTGVR